MTTRPLWIATILSLSALAAGCGGEGGPATDVTPPGVVSSLAATTSAAQVALTWTNPGDADLQSITVRRSASAVPPTITDGTLAFAGLATAFTDTGLTDGTRYFYALFAVDGSSNVSAGAAIDAVPNPQTPVEVTIPGVGAQRGIFDPSLATDPATGRIWMAHTEVRDSVLWPTQNVNIDNRLAFSDDNGATWTDSGILNMAQDVTLPLAPPNDAGTWQNEVAALVHDPGAPTAERWKLLWHRYLEINGNRVFQHGWTGYRTAPDPTGPWSAERKLFVGSLYDPVNDATIGPPEVQLHLLHADLNGALIFTEPGLLATATSLWVTLLAGEGNSQNGRIILLELPHANPTWRYRGSLLVNAQDGPAFGVHGFSAPALYADGARTFLLISPQTNDIYGGTYVFEVDDLSTGALVRNAGTPVMSLQLDCPPGTFCGAAGYVFEATASGILTSEVVLAPPIIFRIFASRQNP